MFQKLCLIILYLVVKYVNSSFHNLINAQIFQQFKEMTVDNQINSKSLVKDGKIDFLVNKADLIRTA